MVVSGEEESASELSTELYMPLWFILMETLKRTGVWNLI